MAVTRVSTYNVHQTTLREASRVQMDMLNLQQQISSGQKADSFAGLNGQVEQYTALDNSLSRSTLFAENNKLALTRLNSTNAALDQVIDTATSLKNTILLRRNATTENNLAFDQQLEGFFKSLAGQLNSTLEGRYLFSGTATDTAAVSTENFPSLVTPGTPDDGYYQGSNQDITIRIEEQYEMTTNVRANDPAFQKLFAALAIAKDGHALNDDTKLQQAYDLAQEGLTEVITVQTSANASKIAIEQANERLESLKLYWKGVKEDLINTDMISASTQVAINQGILQASFQVFARINSLQLSDYLR